MLPAPAQIVDTGVDLTHPDIAANLWVNPGEIPGNGIDDDGNGEAVGARRLTILTCLPKQVAVIWALACSCAGTEHCKFLQSSSHSATASVAWLICYMCKAPFSVYGI